MESKDAKHAYRRRSIISDKKKGKRHAEDSQTGKQQYIKHVYILYRQLPCLRLVVGLTPYSTENAFALGTQRK